MGLAHVRGTGLDTAGNIVTGLTIAVRQPGTATLITDTIYTNGTGSTVLANPFTVGALGDYEFYIKKPQRVDLFISGTGFTSRTITVDAEEESAGILNVKSFGAKGDGVTDDTASIQATLNALAAAGGGAMLIPAGTYQVSAELTYDANSGPIKISGPPNAVLRLTGVSNKGIHVTGTTGVTSNLIVIEGFKIVSATSGVSAAAIHLDGIAIYACHDLDISPAAKLAVGVLFSGGQQGEYSGGHIAAATCLKYELNAGIASNGCDLHGVSMSGSSVGVSLSGVDSSFIHSNHIVAPIGIDILTGGFGHTSIFHNHIELHTTAGIRANACAVEVVGNQFFTGAGAPSMDLVFTDVDGFFVMANLFNGSISFDANCSLGKYLMNQHSGAAARTFTNNSVGLQKWGNHHAGGGANVEGGVISDSMEFTSRSGTAGDILNLKPNSLVAGSWGMTVGSAGASADSYYRLKPGGPIMAGNTGDGDIYFKSGVGGNTWVRFSEALDGETSFIVRVKRGGAFALDRVTYGAVDSGGAGFRVLRIPN